ncbi:PREDICTED: uncharacterized protein LOC105315970 [Amphimedon queenslandica]|uniref:Integrase catalytic domain-containing protein n=1 Tax=Amphimedon queenslandica TaxID=400682 RepID=A0AAN0ITM9_AMPQE|nr:PREDICTED: uncharacterized protein LOC105315970 [Amphimedon queenslandica]|eukprot:XP_011409056.1 PREDICTED: uncharacterized protein LOC105315970 [Amphimedon queenslandica]
MTSLAHCYIWWPGLDKAIEDLVKKYAHSRWLEVCIVPSTSSEATIKVLRRIFSTHGLPHQLVSHNGPSFTSQEIKKFMSLNGIHYSLTAPYYLRSNGLAERAVQTFKNAVKKMEGPLHKRIARFLFLLPNHSIYYWAIAS